MTTNTENVIVPSDLLNVLTALCDVAESIPTYAETARKAREQINKGLSYYNPKSLKEQISEIETIGQCNIAQAWLDERREQLEQV